jgi:hypothetical protein
VLHCFTLRLASCPCTCTVVRPGCVLLGCIVPNVPLALGLWVHDTTQVGSSVRPTHKRRPMGSSAVGEVHRCALRGSGVLSVDAHRACVHVGRGALQRPPHPLHPVIRMDYRQGNIHHTWPPCAPRRHLLQCDRCHVEHHVRDVPTW